MSDPFDDDDRDFDLAKDDGWTNDDIANRRHRSGGLYLGPKDEMEEPGE